MVFGKMSAGSRYDIYIHKNSVKVAVVRSYRSKQKGDGWHIEAHGVYQTDAAVAMGMDCFELSDFQLIVEKHDRTIIYTGCSWADQDDKIREKHLIVARNRWEIPWEEWRTDK